MLDLKTYKSTWKGDLTGGLTAAIIALPMGLAFGIASGLGPAAGLYTAIILAFVASFVGGTKTLISDPTGPMAIVAATVVFDAYGMHGQSLHAAAMIFGTFFLAGLVQVSFGFLHIAQYVKFISYPVISGFMTGIGLIIIILQLNGLVGGVNPDGGVIGILRELSGLIESINLSAVLLSALTVGLIFGLPLISRKIPSTLVALIAGTLVAYFGGMDVPVIGKIETALPEIHKEIFLDVTFEDITTIVVNAIMLALLGTIDTLLTSVVADNLTKTKHNGDRELIGQGIGNAICGLFGAIPGAGATLGTVVNINTGARSNLSGMSKGIFLMIIVLGLGQYVALVPKPVLAGILLTVGVGIIDLKSFKKLYKFKAEIFVLISVILITVLYDLLAAVGFGMVLSSFMFIERMTKMVEDQTVHGELEAMQKGLKIPDALANRVYEETLDGPLFFGFADQFKAQFRSIKDVDYVILKMHKVPYVDISGISAIEDVVSECKSRGITVCLVGVSENIYNDFEDLGVIPNIIGEQHVYNTLKSCIKFLKYNLVEE